MKKFAMLISLMTLLLAFTVTTVSAQKVTTAQKATTQKVSEQKVSNDKTAPATKACSADQKGTEKKACCAGKEKAGCSKSCSHDKAACTHEGQGKTEAAPVPKSK